MIVSNTCFTEYCFGDSEIHSSSNRKGGPVAANLLKTKEGVGGLGNKRVKLFAGVVGATHMNACDLTIKGSYPTL